MTVSWPSVVLLGLLAVLAGTMLWVIRDKTAFLARTPALETAADLAAFKRLAARDMWLALASIAAGVAAAVLFTFAFMLDWIEPLERVTVPLAWAAVLTPLGVWGKRRERAVKGMPTAEPLRAERDRVVKVWMTKAVPDWT